jgi:hypothetical protein
MKEIYSFEIIHLERWVLQKGPCLNLDLGQVKDSGTHDEDS